MFNAESGGGKRELLVCAIPRLQREVEVNRRGMVGRRGQPDGRGLVFGVDDGDRERGRLPRLLRQRAGRELNVRQPAKRAGIGIAGSHGMKARRLPRIAAFGIGRPLDDHQPARLLGLFEEQLPFQRMRAQQAMAKGAAAEGSIELLGRQERGLGLQVAPDRAETALAILGVVAVVAPVVEDRQVHARGQVRQPLPGHVLGLAVLAHRPFGRGISPFRRDDRHVDARRGA